MEQITITPDELKALIKVAVREELADFFFRNNGLLGQTRLVNGTKKIEEFDFSARLYTFLRKNKIFTFEDMLNLDFARFSAIRGKTNSLWRELQEVIEEELEEKDS